MLQHTTARCHSERSEESFTFLRSFAVAQDDTLFIYSLLFIISSLFFKTIRPYAEICQFIFLDKGVIYDKIIFAKAIK